MGRWRKLGLFLVVAMSLASCGSDRCTGENYYTSASCPGYGATNSGRMSPSNNYYDPYSQYGQYGNNGQYEEYGQYGESDPYGYY